MKYAPGDIAQLVEHFNGIEGVSGSNPLISINYFSRYFICAGGHTTTTRCPGFVEFPPEIRFLGISSGVQALPGHRSKSLSENFLSVELSVVHWDFSDRL